MIRRDDVRSVELVKTRAKRIGHKVGAVQGSFEGIPGDGLHDAVLYYKSLHHAINRGRRCRSSTVREAVLLVLLGELSFSPVIFLAVVIGRTITVLGDLLFFAGGLIAGRFYGVGVPAPPGGNNNA
ncbi:hypothetical protein RFN29_08270 [Mesorhizobium sp. VK22B]|uniref:Uncharacterized protein n=1 Tax=Mesorhizobium captivum TaxID=3072319 RepID=A0ABU4Z0K7_9HYPH|nr:MULTISPECIES: hypothetical protein [unclassified Mesorhizobium]MDX8491572.1 hypothetical protein [Mesorhizobium sp. VK22B]MDX8505185.1 hypothetical protein [Mesorhizobium sp. VK22E]